MQHPKHPASNRSQRARPLRILACLHEYPPACSGIGYVGSNIVSQLRKRGHHVDVCAPTNADIVCGNASLIRVAGGIGILWYWWRAAGFIRKNADAYDIIWLQNPLPLRSLPAGNIVCTTHTTYTLYTRTLSQEQVSFFLRAYNRLMMYAEKQSYRLLARMPFVITSELTRTELAHLGIPCIRARIENGVDTALFNPADAAERPTLRRALQIPADADAFLFVGRLSHQKRPLTLIKIFVAFQKKTTKPSVLRLIGSGPLEHDVLQEIAIAKKSGCDIVLLPPLAQQQLRDYYRACDYIIMPSAYEGQPLALFEAMSCGLVPIVSPIPIFEEIIRRAKAGLCVDFDRPNAPSIIRTFVSRQQGSVRTRLGAYIRTNYDWSVPARAYESLFFEVHDHHV